MNHNEAEIRESLRKARGINDDWKKEWRWYHWLWGAIFVSFCVFGPPIAAIWKELS